MSDPADRVIRALSDPHRRAMLDALRERDGQTVSELGAAVPMLGRHAVLKHLRALEDADLVTTRKEGRHRVSHLNAVPVVDLARRWLDDFGAHWGLALTDLRDDLEQHHGPRHHRPRPDRQGAPVSETTTRVFSIVIAASRQKVWEALTDPGMTERWYFHSRVSLGATPGSTLEYRRGDGSDEQSVIAGEVLEVDPPRLLKATFHARWSPDVAADEPTLHTWTLEDEDGLTRLTLVHEKLVPGTATEQQVTGGWPYLLSSVKTLVETGRTLEELAGTPART